MWSSDPPKLLSRLNCFLLLLSTSGWGVHLSCTTTWCSPPLSFTAFSFSGSGAMLSEGIHSLADVLNQILLLVGIQRAGRKADGQYAYGYGREVYIWALISAVGIFFLGCGVTVYHGIESLLHPPEEVPRVRRRLAPDGAGLSLCSLRLRQGKTLQESCPHVDADASPDVEHRGNEEHPLRHPARRGRVLVEI